MATSPHVSRVSKDYAPHGYAISNDGIGYLEIDSAVTGFTEDDMPIVFADNGDYVLKKATLFSPYNPTGDLVGANYEISVEYEPVGGPGAPVVLASVNTHGMPANGPPAPAPPSIGMYVFDIPEGIVVAPSLLRIKAEELGGVPAGGAFGGMIALRYEAKA